jgi:eukaryotic-like serine/threonine-protein kinase
MSQSSTAALQEASLEPSYTPVVSSTGMSYQPILELGEGGMSKVFLARARGPSGFSKLVVLKSMRLSDLDDDDMRRMFIDEARLSARFNHPNLVQVQEVNVTAEPPYLIMEYLEGKPLSALRGSERLSLGMRLSIISEVLTGLHHAHELCNYDGTHLGIVHRDISPHNVFISYDGAVKVLDFGIAKVVTNSTRTEAGEVKGKLAYMAPEQLLGSGVDRRADVFSVGSMLWEAAAGRRMWDGLSEGALMHRLSIGEIPRASQHAAVDPELEEIIVKATAAKPEERFESALELQVELDRYRTRACEHSSLREIGTLLADSFQTERRRNAELISQALKQSMPPPPPPPAPGTSATLVAQVDRRNRVPLLIAVALGVLAGAGFLGPRLWSSGSQTSEPRAQPSTGVATTQATAQQAEPTATSPTGAFTGSSSATTRADADPPEKTSRVKGPRRSATPAAPVAPAASTTPVVTPAAPAPAAEQRCSPPYYFVNGIKTYKPECL